MRLRGTLVMVVTAGLAVAAAQARGGHEARAPAAPAAPDLGAWTRPLGAATLPAAPARQPAAEPEIDVVDAHWMALTMWGEARREGEAGMRAVGHVIDNRRRAGMHGAAYVTDTVGRAFQFSCWNAGDPNREKMLDIARLAPDSADYHSWRLARQLAGEIMAGRSRDPTGGALFYHGVAVAPAWSAGIPPVRRIGSHLFFLASR
jgi:N-acetylmuramoyl-L-alanine amidase